MKHLLTVNIPGPAPSLNNAYFNNAHGGRTMQTSIKHWKAGVTRVVDAVDFSQGEVDLHFAARGGGTVLERGDGSRVSLEWSEAFDTLVVWTLPGADFVCVEPWTARGAKPATRFVAAGKTDVAVVSMRLT